MLLPNKIGSLREVINCISDFQINIVNIPTTNKLEYLFYCLVIIKVKHIMQLKDLIIQLNNLKSLYSLIRYAEKL